MRFDNKTLSRWSALTAAILLSQGCGQAVKNENIPKGADELTTDDVTDDGVKKRQSKWEELATALGIGNNRASTSADLVTQLGTVSTYLSTNSAALPGLMTTLTTQYAATANKARCAAVDSVTEWKAAYDATGAAVAAKVYLMKYKLQTDTAGTAEDITRAGLFVVPDAGVQNSRLIAYGHGGDSGLSYDEIAANFGALQASNVIVAPAFPSEAVCNAKTGDNKACDAEGNLADGVGTAVPYDNDADDLLGMYDCVFRAYAGNNAAPYNMSAASNYRTRIKPYGGSNPLATVPHAVLAGASRGGLVSMVAAGRMGAHLAAGAATGALGTAYGSPSFFGCAVNFAGPVGPTVGKARIYFELLVKGTIENSAFINLPGIRKLKDLFNDYINDEVTADVAKMRAVQRDVSLTSPLISAALQNWKTYAGSTQDALIRSYRGRVLWMHGDADATVPVTDTQLSYNVLAGMTATQVGYKLGSLTGTSTMPGVNVTSRIFTGAGHFDSAYYTATGTYPSNYVATASVTAASAALDANPTAGVDGFLNSASQLDATMSDTLTSWMADSSYGCTF
jgi:hypothetical protein